MSICEKPGSGFSKTRDWRFFCPWFLASKGRSRSNTNLAFCTAFSPLLDFNGSARFGTWRIFVPLFWATCRLFSIFLLFWVLEHFCLWILYTLFTLVLLKHQGEVFFGCGFSYSVLPFVLLWQKGDVYISFWTGNVFLTGQVIFVPK
jgi:hypothetical protein